MYVADCIDAILLALKKSKNKINIFNLGQYESIELNHSISHICKKLNSNPEIIYSGGIRGWIGDNPHIHLDINKITKLGWEPKFSIQHGIEKTIDFLLDNEWLLHKKQLRWMKLLI